MGLEVIKYFHLGGFKRVHFELHIHEMLHKQYLIVEKCSLRGHYGCCWFCTAKISAEREL